jgi:hypothetical protein
VIPWGSWNLSERFWNIHNLIVERHPASFRQAQDPAFILANSHTKRERGRERERDTHTHTHTHQNRDKEREKKGAAMECK